MIILSDYDVLKLGMALEIVKESEDKRVLLLSDALYLFGRETNEAMKEMMRVGAKIIALEVDIKKRGVDAASKHVIAASYEGLVEELLDRRGSIVNL